MMRRVRGLSAAETAALALAPGGATLDRLRLKARFESITLAGGAVAIDASGAEDLDAGEALLAASGGGGFASGGSKARARARAQMRGRRLLAADARRGLMIPTQILTTQLLPQTSPKPPPHNQKQPKQGMFLPPSLPHGSGPDGGALLHPGSGRGQRHAAPGASGGYGGLFNEAEALALFGGGGAYGGGDAWIDGADAFDVGEADVMMHLDDELLQRHAAAAKRARRDASGGSTRATPAPSHPQGLLFADEEYGALAGDEPMSAAPGAAGGGAPEDAPPLEEEEGGGGERAAGGAGAAPVRRGKARRGAPRRKRGVELETDEIDDLQIRRAAWTRGVGGLRDRGVLQSALRSTPLLFRPASLTRILLLLTPTCRTQPQRPYVPRLDAGRPGAAGSGAGGRRRRRRPRRRRRRAAAGELRALWLRRLRQLVARPEGRSGRRRRAVHAAADQARRPQARCALRRRRPPGRRLLLLLPP